jgi:hypothetical protein
MSSVAADYHLAMKAGYERIHELSKLASDIAKLSILQEETEEFNTARFHFIGRKLVICAPVKKLADIEPLLDHLQKKFGFEFDSTVDAPEYGWRQFESTSASWLCVNAELIGDSIECRRVVVGYQDPLPIYKFECSEVRP